MLANSWIHTTIVLICTVFADNKFFAYLRCEKNETGYKIISDEPTIQKKRNHVQTYLQCKLDSCTRIQKTEFSDSMRSGRIGSDLSHKERLQGEIVTLDGTKLKLGGQHGLSKGESSSSFCRTWWVVQINKHMAVYVFGTKWDRVREIYAMFDG